MTVRMERSDSNGMAGLLLTGGASERMGRPKAAIELDGASFARRCAEALRTVADPVLAVGPAYDSGLESVDDTHEGPLLAFVAGADALAARGHTGPICLVACDVPLVGAKALSLVASLLDGHDGVVPVVGGRDQPSVSAWSPVAVDAARRLAAAGHRSMRAWIAELDVRRLTEADWDGIVSESAFTDVDTPDELARLIPRAD